MIRTCWPPVAASDYVRGSNDERWLKKNSQGLKSWTTACVAYFILQALYQSGRRAEADANLLPMLHSFADGGFQSSSPSGRSYD
jgi:hypothetical protein